MAVISRLLGSFEVTFLFGRGTTLMVQKKSFKSVNMRLQHKPILDHGIPEIIVYDKNIKEKTMLLHAVPSDDKRPKRCPHCGHDKIYVQQQKTKQFRDLDIGFYHVGIVLHFNCYQCKNCKSVLTPEFHFADGNFTKRLKEKIQHDAFELEFADVAKAYGIPAMTVGRFFREKAEEYWATYEMEMPEVLGIDEVHLKKHYYGVLVNVNKAYGDVIDLSPERSKESIKATIASFAHPERLKMVTIDMWRPYRDAVRDLFPNVPVVIDRFHVIKELQKGLETIRRRISRKIKEERDNNKNKHERVRLQEEKKSLKNNRFLLLFSMENLSPKQVQNRDKILNDYPEFREPYIIKEAFRAIYELAKSKAEALAQYEDWKKDASKYPEYQPFIDTVENWKDEIFAYFDFEGDNRTNAQTESLNGIIKEKERNGRGLSYEVMRAKLIFRRQGQRTVKQFDFNAFKS